MKLGRRLEGNMLVLHAAAMVDEPQADTENAGRDDSPSRGGASSGLAGPGTVVLALLFIYFGLPAFWVKPLTSIPGAERVIEPIAMPIDWLYRSVPPYRSYVDAQSRLVGLKK